MNERVTAIISTAQTTESFDTRFLSDFFPLFLSFFFFPPPLSSSSWSCPLFMNIPATITKRPLSFAGEYSDAVASFEWRRTNARASKVSLSLSLSCGKCETWWERQDLSRVVEMTERQRMWNRDGDVLGSFYVKFVYEFEVMEMSLEMVRTWRIDRFSIVDEFNSREA